MSEKPDWPDARTAHVFDYHPLGREAAEREHAARGSPDVSSIAAFAKYIAGDPRQIAFDTFLRSEQGRNAIREYVERYVLNTYSVDVPPRHDDADSTD